MESSRAHNQTLFALLLGLAFWASNAIAAECEKATTQIDLNMCSERTLEESEIALANVQQQIVDRLKERPETLNALNKAQQTWLTFRNAECAFASSDGTGGSAYSMIVSRCREGLNRERTKRLALYLTCEEGDPLCPVPK